MRVLHVAAVGCEAPGGQAVAAIALRWADDDRRRIMVRRHRSGSRTVAVYRAFLLALWEAQRLGARALTAQLDDAAIIAQLGGAEAIGPEVLGVHLQIRALLHTFRSVEVCYSPAGTDLVAAAAAAARVAHPNRASCAELPLWAAAS